MKIRVSNEWLEVTDLRMFNDTVHFRAAGEDKDGNVVLGWVPVMDVQQIEGRPVRLN